MPCFSVFVDQTNLKTNWKFSLSQYWCHETPIMSKIVLKTEKQGIVYFSRILIYKVVIKAKINIINMYKYYMPLRVSVKTAINLPLGKYDLLNLNCKISKNHPEKYIIKNVFIFQEMKQELDWWGQRGNKRVRTCNKHMTPHTAKK